MVDIGYLGPFRGEGEKRRPVLPVNGIEVCLPEFIYWTGDMAEYVDILHWGPVNCHDFGGWGMWFKGALLDHSRPEKHRVRLSDQVLLKMLWSMADLASAGPPLPPPSLPLFPPSRKEKKRMKKE